MPFWLLFGAIALLGLAYYRASIRVSSVVLGLAVLLYGVFGGSGLLFILLALAWALVFLPLSVAALRQEWLSRPALDWFRRVCRRLDPEALAALDAGSAWWEAELLGGEPDWERFQAFAPARPLSSEQAEVEALVAGLRATAPAEARAWLRAQRGFGMGIAERYRGLAWSAAAQSLALMQIAAIDPVLAAAAGDPARLAWIELLRRHAGEAQQERWLPLLAEGAAIAGVGDAIAGIALAARKEGEDGLVLRLRMNSPAGPGSGDALGLLVEVRDPEQLLGGRGGLACLLLPGDQPGLRLEDGAWRAEGCEVGLDAVIGGAARIGCGGGDWSECLAIAHALVTPALHAGGAAAAAAAAGACARIHAPFATPTGGRALAQESLALIGARAAAAQALAAVTALAVDLGERPQGLAAFARSLAAEQAAQVQAALADLGVASVRMAVAASSESGRLARPASYTAGVLRGHAAFMQALAATRQANAARALEQFDAALWSHAGHCAATGVRALLMGLTAGSFSTAAGNTELARGCCRRINRYSAALAFATDLALTRLGADLASREPRTAVLAARTAARLTLTTWLGDAAAQLWLASCALKQFEDHGAPADQRAALEWLCADALRSVEAALDQVLRHLSMPVLSWFARLLIFPLGHAALAPGDAVSRAVARGIVEEGGRRLEACGPRLQLLSEALAATLAGEPVEKRAAAQPGAAAPALRIADAEAAGLVSAEQARQLQAWLAAVRRLERSASL